MNTPDGWDPLKIVKPEHPEFLAAEARAKELTDQAFANEAISIIAALEDEVTTMHISNRYSATKKPNFDYMTQMPNPMLADLPEAEHRRQILLGNLRRLKNDIGIAVSNLRDLIMEIEATKIDDPIPQKGQQEVK